MKNIKKIVLSLLAIGLLLGATPALANLNGPWKGDGKGVCSPPPGVPNEFPIYAWQSWEGKIEDIGPDEFGKVFFGNWKDKTGNYGSFKGKIIWMTQTQAYCEGEWTWVYETLEFIKVYEMGRFTMTFEHFPVETPYCYGSWSSKYGNEDGAMKGHMVF